MERLATVRHLIDSAEHPVQALERVLDFLRIEMPSLLWAGIYVVRARRLEPGPCCGTQGNGATGGRELALRSAFSAAVQQEGAGLAIPVLSGKEVRAVLALRSGRPEQDFTPAAQELLAEVAGLLEPLV
jgi:putative methionine-R-sulfoxide reductase with GAF domain